MMKAGMPRPGIYQMRKPHLADTPQPLEMRMIYQLLDKRIGNGDETENRVVKNFGLKQYNAVQ